MFTELEAREKRAKTAWVGALIRAAKIEIIRSMTCWLCLMWCPISKYSCYA